VVVLIARGMMDTTLVTWNTFHGARTGDVDVAARALRDGLVSLADSHDMERRQILAGVGYSMGESCTSCTLLITFHVSYKTLPANDIAPPPAAAPIHTRTTVHRCHNSFKLRGSLGFALRWVTCSTE
jgi:hypothetical protein